MFKHLGSTESEIGTVIYIINDDGFFEIRTPKRVYAVDESELIEKDGKCYFPLPKTDYMIVNEDVFSDIEIQEDVLEEMEKALIEFKLQEQSIGSTETTQGRVFFSLSRDGQIISRLNEKSVKTDRIYTVEGRRTVFVPDLELDFPFVEISADVEQKFNAFKKDQAAKSLCLLYAGRSLLNGKDFFKFNVEVSDGTMYRVKELFEYFDEENEDSVLGGLQGWLTSQPELAEEYLRIRDPISGRQAEIEKLKEQAVKANLKIIKELTGAAE